MPQPHFYTASQQSSKAQGSQQRHFTNSTAHFPVLFSNHIRDEVAFRTNNASGQVKGFHTDLEGIRISPQNHARRFISRFDSEGLLGQNTKPCLTLDLKLVELPFMNHKKMAQGPIEMEPMSAPLLSRPNFPNLDDNEDKNISRDEDSSLFEDLSPIRTTKASQEPSSGDWAVLNVFDLSKEEREDSIEDQEQSHTFKDESLKMHNSNNSLSRDMSTDFSMEIEEGNVEMGSEGPDGSRLQSTDMILVGLNDELSLQL